MFSRRNQYFLKDHFDALERRDLDLFDHIFQQKPAFDGAGNHPVIARFMHACRDLTARIRTGAGEAA